MTTTVDEPAIDMKTIASLARRWPKRAAVRSGRFDAELQRAYDPAQPDFPTTLIPFWSHPRFQAAPDYQRQMTLTWAWIAYNQRTIDAEDHVANPAFEKLLAGNYSGLEAFETRQAIRQSLVDEHYHSLMHAMAMEKTHLLRGTDSNFRFPRSVTARILSAELSKCVDEWERDLLLISFAVVSEISINAYLELLAKDAEVHPLHRKVAQLHNRDECAHSSLLVEVCKLMYPKFNRKQQTFFCHTLPVALRAFVAHDFSVFSCILEKIDVDGRESIIADAAHSAGGLVRDYSGLKRLVEELGIERDVDFEFVD